MASTEPVNEILDSVSMLAPNANDQINILAAALIATCASCNVSKEDMLRGLDALFDLNNKKWPRPQ